jgi:hypothetical protein
VKETPFFSFYFWVELVQDILEQSYVGPQELEKRYAAYKHLAEIRVDSFLADWKTAEHSLDDYEKKVTFFYKVMQQPPV